MTEMDISLNKLTRKLGQLLSFKTARLSVARCKEAKEGGKTQSNFNKSSHLLTRLNNVKMTEMDISLNKLTRKLGQLLSFKTARVSVARCQGAEEGGKTQSNFNERPRFPTSEEEVIANTQQILMEMEYRSVRAAKMCYEHSAEFDRNHFWLTILATIGIGIISLTFTIKNIDWITVQLGNKLSQYVTAFVIATIPIFTCFTFAPEYLLPLYSEKQRIYNEAGAGWQELELNIRSYRATQLRDKIVLEELRNELEKFAKTRKDICEKARPSEKKHTDSEKEEFVKELINIKKHRKNAIKNYFETDQGN